MTSQKEFSPLSRSTVDKRSTIKSPRSHEKSVDAGMKRDVDRSLIYLLREVFKELLSIEH